jgi:hypothetical protein
MINCKKAMATAAAAAGALLAGVVGSPAASAEDTSPSARILSVVHRPGSDVAVVTVEYTCQPADFTHLWVSVKQGGHDLEGEGSSQRARAWYDSHPGQDAGAMAQDPPVCDGSTRLARFEVFRHTEGKHLNRSDAWVQFCLIQFDESGGEEPSEFLSENQWTKVKAAPSVR